MNIIERRLTFVKCLMYYIKQSRLYEESSHLHATHDADLLKKLDGNTNAQKDLPERVLVRLQAGAFLSLCHHLRNRSDEVQNMELMTISGFCRNCLAKVSASFDAAKYLSCPFHFFWLHLFVLLCFSGWLFKHARFRMR